MTAAALEPGSRINDKYEILELIGAGAHGTVYRAIQHPVIRTVALKFISRHLSQDPDNRERFFHEARALARGRRCRNCQIMATVPLPAGSMAIP